jgi:RimJ/RimL family protein N-acetyltransferase
MPRTNAYGQAIGEPVDGWVERPRPPRTVLEGQYCRLEPLSAARHAPELFAANSAAEDGRAWTYLLHEPFTDLGAFTANIERAAASVDPLYFAVVDGATARAVGVLSLMRIDTEHGVVEVGDINYSPQLQRTRAATEAQYLLMQLAFDTLGYRRYEWKCDSLNAPSRSAALRYGFSFEGIFRQARVYKGRSRDTAWFSIIDGEWPLVKAAFEAWLAPGNFDAKSQQLRSLADIRNGLYAEAVGN